ncbi:unnamed protein product [Vitrella brassicaformis CCMP3155]|uniref:Major facilitator superfamily (MFS) profile domain-containing protein n=1 Tax=Vitrella brassicaformis (strain CCMP3155) TaxID=1169540 RepID=A0A0G4G7M9_VITBC|nr:unnamed protein product [Vitrella brassicaformis CCMP3155]|mmetsp:Transcript_36082/g.103612  ORF Transcript_36082/g.103612 Transcript_36082/m.103612 type:complete len:644 (-) Transcript_36082:550-2481(-)|eukprot:CEM24414.1 unnamed protein product [Vitrella brassicaformis CCMP3155]
MGDVVLNRNIWLMFLFRFFNGVAYVTRSGYIFDQYLHLQFGTNTKVGWFTFLGGMTTLLVSMPAGLLCDHPYFVTRRSKILQVCSLVTAVCIATNYYALQTDYEYAWYAVTIAWRFWYEFAFVASEALYAESIPQGERSRFYVYRRAITTLSNGLGPLVQIFLFRRLGDVWDVAILRAVMFFGLLVSLPQALILWAWTDKVPSTDSRRQLLMKSQKADAGGSAAAAAAAEYDDRRRTDMRCVCFDERHIPWIVFFSHFVTFAGAGMTVKYFNLFFKKEYGLKPTGVLTVQLFYTLAIAAMTFVVQYMGASLGRAQVSLYFTVAGCLCLVGLSVARNFWVAVTVHILRGSLQNASTPIDRSIIADFVSSKNRGKWTSLQSLITSTWAASALFGGWLADTKDYRFTFQITALVYMLANVIYTPLVCLVPKSEKLEAPMLPTAMSPNNDSGNQPGGSSAAPAAAPAPSGLPPDSSSPSAPYTSFPPPKSSPPCSSDQTPMENGPTELQQKQQQQHHHQRSASAGASASASASASAAAGGSGGQERKPSFLSSLWPSRASSSRRKSRDEDESKQPLMSRFGLEGGRERERDRHDTVSVGSGAWTLSFGPTGSPYASMNTPMTPARSALLRRAATIQEEASTRQAEAN